MVILEKLLWAWGGPLEAGTTGRDCRGRETLAMGSMEGTCVTTAAERELARRSHILTRLIVRKRASLFHIMVQTFQGLWRGAVNPPDRAVKAKAAAMEKESLAERQRWRPRSKTQNA
eukprot:Gb_17383 [translate_table: standard]